MQLEPAADQSRLHEESIVRDGEGVKAGGGPGMNRESKVTGRRRVSMVG
jgi:hypothetical protein